MKSGEDTSEISRSSPPGSSGAPLARFHPDAPRPPFMWSAQLPVTWRVIDTHPAQWQLTVERVADDYLPGVRLSSAQKRAVKQQLEQVVQQCQKAGVLVVLVLPGVVEDDVSAATLLFRWVDSSPAPASIMAAERQLQGKAAVVEQTGRGDSFVFVSMTEQVGPLSNRRMAYTYQALLPVAGTSWTLMVSGSAPNQDTGEIVADIVRRVVASVRTYPDTVGETLFDDAGDPDDAGVQQSSDSYIAMITDDGVFR
ncbi:hypothetical protein [Corynebacterium cystitidis]|uniref:hypothetical protein n=1 Tax=Corynebacterium cystitidis TaxID=35757 RepID=UPI00211E94AD|nr:hypothetical protein [Corynebacterium cystitidis]